MTVAGLETDYNLSAASVRTLAVRPALGGLCVSLTLAVPRKFGDRAGAAITCAALALRDARLARAMRLPAA